MRDALGTTLWVCVTLWVCAATTRHTITTLSTGLSKVWVASIGFAFFAILLFLSFNSADKLDFLSFKIDIIDKLDFLSFKIDNSTDKLDFLSFKVDNSTDKLDFLSFKIDLLSTVQLAPEEIVSESAEFSAMIQISPASSDGNSKACGTVVVIDDNTFLLTSKHVVVDVDHSCHRTIVSIKQRGEVELVFDERKILLHPRLDLALVPVEAKGGATISLEPVALHTLLTGTAYREKGTYAVSGVLRESTLGEAGMADLQGTHGFSGLGYFSSSIVNGMFNGTRLVSVHRGRGAFLHFGEPAPNFDETFRQTDVVKAKLDKKCFKDHSPVFHQCYQNDSSCKQQLLNTFGLPQGRRECWDAVLDHMDIASRNPLVNVVFANHVLSNVMRHHSLGRCDERK